MYSNDEWKCIRCRPSNRLWPIFIRTVPTTILRLLTSLLAIQEFQRVQDGIPLLQEGFVGTPITVRSWRTNCRARMNNSRDRITQRSTKERRIEQWKDSQSPLQRSLWRERSHQTISAGCTGYPLRGMAADKICDHPPGPGVYFLDTTGRAEELFTCSLAPRASQTLGRCAHVCSG